MWTRIAERRILNGVKSLTVVALIVATSCLVAESNASIAMELNVDIDLSRNASLSQSNSSLNYLGKPATSSTDHLAQQVTSSINDNADSELLASDQSMKSAESRTSVHHQSLKSQPADTVPVYRSAPKQIDALHGLNPSFGGQLQKSPGAQPLFQLDRGKQQHQLPVEIRREHQQGGENRDLNHAAAGHYKKHKQKKIRPKKKKKVKIMAKKKKVIVVVKKKKIGKRVYHLKQHKRPKHVVKEKHFKENYQPHYLSSPSLGKYFE